MNPQVAAITSVINPNDPMSGQPMNSSDAIIKQLNQVSGIVSSSDADLQSQYSAITDKLQASQDKSDVATNASFQLQKEQQTKTNTQNINSTEAASQAYGANTALLKQVMDTADQSLKDLELQRTIAINSGDAATAKEIATIATAALQDRQKHIQDIFNNMITIASFGETAKKNAADIANMQFTQGSTMTTLAAKYGVSVSPGETMTTLAAKIAPNASREENSAIDLQLAQAENLRASAQKSIADANATNAKVATGDLQTMADYVNSLGGAESADGKGFLATMKNPGDAAKIAKIADQAKIVNLINSSYVLQGKTKQQAQADIQSQYNSGSIPASQYSSFLDAVDTAYSNMTLPQTPVVGARRGFVAPGTYGPGGLGSVKRMAPASAEAIAALNQALKGTAFR